MIDLDSIRAFLKDNSSSYEEFLTIDGTRIQALVAKNFLTRRKSSDLQTVFHLTLLYGSKTGDPNGIDIIISIERRSQKTKVWNWTRFAVSENLHWLPEGGIIKSLSGEYALRFKDGPMKPDAGKIVIIEWRKGFFSMGGHIWQDAAAPLRPYPEVDAQ